MKRVMILALLIWGCANEPPPPKVEDQANNIMAEATSKALLAKLDYNRDSIYDQYMDIPFDSVSLRMTYALEFSEWVRLNTN